VTAQAVAPGRAQATGGIVVPRSGAARPIDWRSFAAALDALGPFEPAPALAVAVSGGADSVALALLADRWARARRGRIVALTVDHCLRTESAAEARTVARWMAARDIASVCLKWRRDEGDHAGVANLQARARAARYRLMAEWCAARSVLHLLLAHHRDDQAETLLLRLGRGSGVDGLSAMAPVAETYAVRLLRPLLAFPRARLEATLRGLDQPWIDDPSNRNARFARVRLRALAPALASEGMTSERLAATAARLRGAREALERMTADFLARAATPFAEGYVTLDRAALRTTPAEVAARAISRLVAAVGGLAYVPRRERTEGLVAKLMAPSRPPRPGTNDSVLATLGGVLIVAGAAGMLLFAREPSAVAPPLAIAGPGVYAWDNRFRITIQRSDAVPLRGALAIGALGNADQGILGKKMADAAALAAIAALPRRVRDSLPVLVDGANRPLALANFGYAGNYGRPGAGTDSLRPGRWALDASFAPPLPLAGPGTSVSSLFKAQGDTI
jgi:tRNA(Ile)-lysidine synthase